MFVRRCAWHRKYHGYIKILGVSTWQGWGLTFSDGMCSDCAARARAEWRLPAASPRPAPVRPIRRSFRPDFAFAAVVLLAAIGVTFGVVVGPPDSRTASQSTAPAPSVVASRETGEAPRPRLDATPTRPSRPRGTAQSTVQPSAQVAEAPGGAEVPGDLDRTVIARPAPPVRVARVASRRAVTASYRPGLMPRTFDIVSTPAAIETPKPLPVQWLAAAPGRFDDVQAP